ncbi:leucine rich repeat domain containing protein [Sporothrix brasiliensis 5110]|uniref:Leucine rich repeat domain containing protein n=1 Tax=Sporothrix brasiliensis 5110 TaxID=1398154 RepID=A0A0C2ID71_9PEZI|nr:leucine rich repeat domain containing protein [Sporothrix brasiliensis 5110]KIH87216.1 leucine rich repeat domain containing protein [Sporothrix brasiliensis 5110]
MDILRRKRSNGTQQASMPPPSAPSLTFTPISPVSPVSLDGVSSSTSSGSKGGSSTAAISKSRSHNDMAGLTTNSRTSSIDSNKSGFFHGYMPRAMRTLSRGSNASIRQSAASSTTSMNTAATSPDVTPSSSSPQQQFISQFPRKVLRKSHKRKSSSHELNSRRGSTSSDVFSRVSRASTTLSGSSSSNIIDWRIQPIEMHTSLDYPESLSSKNRLSYLVATADYIIIFKTRADAFAALPQLADVAAQSPESATTSKPSSMLPPADPVHVIPLHAIISVFRTDTMRAPYGIEIWWRMPYPAIATCSSTIYFKDGRDRENYLDMLASMVKIRNQDQPDASRVYYEVEECIRKVFQAEEPGFTNTIPEIFPVVYRNAPDRIKSKADDKQLRKGQIEGVSSHYLVVGVNLCFFIQISRASAVQSTALEMKYQTCGLVTLESFAADWTSRDERFAMRFRDPFKSPVGLELSSRHYRRIILTLTKADKFLKPAWPTQWQIQEVFHVAGLPTPQHIVAGEDFGGFQRTLSAFYAAYRCNPVDWEINWRTPFAPEFRVLPSVKGVYTDLQLLAVLRALRYNDYFKSLSFCDVDLSGLLGKFDSSRKGNVAYLSRNASDQPEGIIAPGQEAVSLEALDVASCGLADLHMKMLFQALSQSAWTLQMLDVSQNFGRAPAALIQQFMESVGSLRQLNLASGITGTFEGELLPLEVLDRLEYLEVLDISNFKLNESSVNALETFLQTLSARQASMQNGGYGYSLRRLVLNNCGITGHLAGRIFNAMAGLYDIHLHLSSNPLEDGIADFVSALGHNWGGRFGLHLNMIEFQNEAKYIQLMGALASNPFIDYLSLVGTAPVPVTDDACSDNTIEALERFFEENQSVRYLDISGYCGKLDDGQLGKGFGRALRGLANNKTLTHLRVRNQRLHDSTGTFGTAVQANKALLYLDCGDNGFNATSLLYMAKSLETNTTLLVYPFSSEDLEDVLKHCVKGIPPPPSPTQPSNSKHKKKLSGPTVDPGLERQKELLRGEIEAAASEIMSYMSRNMTKLQQDTGCVLDLGEAYDTCGERGWPSLQLRMPEGVMFTTTPMEEEEEQDMQDQSDGQSMDQLSTGPQSSSHSGASGTPARQQPINSSMVAPQITEDMPYRVQPDDEALNSPIDGSGLSWDLPKTPKVASETTIDTTLDSSFLEKAFLAEPDLSKILEKFTMADGTEYVICTES